jgi:hypothetical protein
VENSRQSGKTLESGPTALVASILDVDPLRGFDKRQRGKCPEIVIAIAASVSVGD